MNNLNLVKYILRFADTSMILGQRLGEWCGHGPVLEEDIALTNIALDHIGQATALYQYAARLEGKGRTEDDMAFLRGAGEFSNLLIVELPNGDYAMTIARQFFFSTWYLMVLERMKNSSNEFIQGFAGKSYKEVSYHLQHSRDWVIRMGDGTKESHDRIVGAVNHLWEFTGEFFEMDDLDSEMFRENVGPDFVSIKTDWLDQVRSVFMEATIPFPEGQWFQTGSKSGIHTEYLVSLLAEMQVLPRTYPGAKW